MSIKMLSWMTLILASSFSTCAQAQDLSTGNAPVSKPATAHSISPIYGVAIPDGYRNWRLIAPSDRPDLGELRAILGNDLAMAAYRSDRLPFPDGTVLVKLAWKKVPSVEQDGAFVPAATTTVQIMVKDSKRYSATGGWGFGRFVDGSPDDEAQHRACFACHQALVKKHDFVFTRYAE